MLLRMSTGSGYKAFERLKGDETGSGMESFQAMMEPHICGERREEGGWGMARCRPRWPSDKVNRAMVASRAPPWAEMLSRGLMAAWEECGLQSKAEADLERAVSQRMSPGCTP